MTETFNDSLMDKKRVKDQLGKADTTVLALSKWTTETLNVYNMRVRVWEKVYNDSFVLGHTTKGVLGTAKLGDRSDAWKIISETGGAEQLTETGKEVIIRFIKGDTLAHFNYVAYGTDSTTFNVNQTSLVTETKRGLTFQGALG